ncbi:MAG: MarR family transcriptional regulator [Candidatus Goldbacteria bacterium]|nr:MarR family transcriptional regulator [Candidatus Goldiibacteriota bacterium]
MQDTVSLLKKAAKVVRCGFNDRLRGSCLTRTQWDVIKEISSGVTKSKDIASNLKSDKPTISGTIKRLHSAGWVIINTDIKDQRLKILSLSPKAKAVIKKGKQCTRMIKDHALKGLKAREQILLNRYLEKIINNFK